MKLFKRFPHVIDRVPVSWNIELIGHDRGKRKVLHERTHNILVNEGRSFVCENIAASAFAGPSFTRHRNTVVRYMGFGIGGNRQTAPSASASPYSDAYPAGYGGTNVQNDTSLTTGRLERPVKATSTDWLVEVATPATFPSPTQVQWVCVFSQAAINIGSFTSVPLAEIALYSSAADKTLPNGGAGTYPGPTGNVLAYDTFDPFNKNAFFSVTAKWTWRLG